MARLNVYGGGANDKHDDLDRNNSVAEFTVSPAPHLVTRVTPHDDDGTKNWRWISTNGGACEPVASHYPGHSSFKSLIHCINITLKFVAHLLLYG